MPSNFKVSSDIDTFLRKSTKEAAATFLGLEDTKAQWGQITGTLTNQTDLVSELALKASQSSVTSLSSTVTGHTTDILNNYNMIVDVQTDVDNLNFQAPLTFGIANTNAVKIDNTSAAANSGDICKFAGSGIMPYTYADLKYDLGVDLKAPIASPSFTGDLILANSSSSVGIRTTSPTAALDVGGTIKADSLNVDAKAFYVDGTDGYIQSEKYGEGTFAAITGSENQPKTTPAFGNNGKVVEKTFIKTLKLQGTGFTGLGTAVQIVAAAGAGKYNVPLEMTIFNDYGTRSGEWGSSGSQASIQIGTFQNSDNTGNFAPFLTLPVSTAENTGDWLAHKTFRNIESKQFSNRDICIKALNSNYPSSEANAPDGEWYIRVEYMVLGESGGFENNVDQTIGTAF